MATVRPLVTESGGIRQASDSDAIIFASNAVGQAPGDIGLLGRSLKYGIANGGAAVQQLGTVFVQTANGGITNGSLSTGDLRQSSVRNQLNASGANAQYSVQWGESCVFRGNADHIGGFYISWRVAWPSVQSDSRILIGLSPSVIGASNPSGNINTVGFAADTGDTNLTILTVDNAGSITKTAIGGGFTKASLATGDPTSGLARVIEWKMWARPNDSEISFSIYDWSNDVEILAPQAVTATLPLNTASLRPQCLGSSGAGGGANTLAFIHVYAYF